MYKKKILKKIRIQPAFFEDLISYHEEKINTKEEKKVLKNKKQRVIKFEKEIYIYTV